MEWCANLEAIDIKPKVQLTHVTAGVAKGVRVFLQQQVLQHPALPHEAEEVVIAPAVRCAGARSDSDECAANVTSETVWLAVCAGP